MADDLRQHLGKLHAQRFIHKCVETEVEKPLHHLWTKVAYQFTHCMTPKMQSNACIFLRNN